MWFWSLGVCLTNAYIMKCNIDLKCGVLKKDLMSQHDFRKHVALAWINPEEYEGDLGATKEIYARKKRKTTTDDSCVSSVTMSSLATAHHSIAFRSPVRTKSRAAAMTDETLDANGKLKIRLNSALDHLPDGTTISSKPRCALHRCVGIQKKAHIMKCTTCNANLCLTCYKLFHNVTDLVSIKQTLKNKYSK